MKYLNFLLLLIPVTIIGRIMHFNEGLIFFAACLSIVPLAVIIGDSTEQISLYTGPKIGGLLNATMGNVPELLIGLFAVMAGKYALVMASMAGSIMGNILLVLGFSIFFGGLKFKFQNFSKTIARSNFTLLSFAAMSIIVPFAFRYATRANENAASGLTAVSFGVAIILLLIYVLGLVFSLGTHKSIFTQHDENGESEEEKPKWTLQVAVTILAVSTLFVAIESEMLVATVEHAVADFGLPEAFIGIILIPILGNVAEHASAVIMAVKNKVDISVEIAVGSSMQIAMFVAPVLVLVSFIIGNPITYVYSFFEVVAMLTGIAMSIYVFQDGKTNWLEGVQLIATYVLLGFAFFFIV